MIPLLDDATTARARGAVRRLSRLVARAAAGRGEDLSLASGGAGLALCQAYLGRALEDPALVERAARRMQQVGRAAARARLPAGLFAGHAGVAWAVAEVAPDPRALAAADRRILAAVRAARAEGRARGDHDLIVGLAGLGVHMLARLPRRTARACLKEIVGALDETADRDGRGLAWATPADRLGETKRALYPDGCYDLGLAHGVAGVIAFLSRVVAAGVERRRALRLLDGAVTWLLARRLPRGARRCFPAMVAPGVPARGLRSAWCYGDPGVALALLAAGRRARKPAWERAALATASAAARRPVEDTMFSGAGLSHGSAGLAHMYHQLHDRTGRPLFARAARAWYARTLDLLDRGELDPDGGEQAGFLDGWGGVAAALAAAISPGRPAWSRLLLADV